MEETFNSFLDVPKNENHRDQFAWRVSSKALSTILPLILPYLIHKKPVCEKLIELYALTLNNGGDRQSKAYKEAAESIRVAKIDIIHKIHSLNKKGIHLSG